MKELRESLARRFARTFAIAMMVEDRDTFVEACWQTHLPEADEAIADVLDRLDNPTPVVIQAGREGTPELGVWSQQTVDRLWRATLAGARAEISAG